VPFVERRVPIIADERVEPEFGTGALKITPGHDPTDFAIGRDHGLPEPSVIGPDGRMNAHAGELDGLTQDEAARRILDCARARALPARGRAVRALRVADRAPDLAPVVVLDGGAEEAGASGASRPRGRLPPGESAHVRDRVARERARLEHLAADLVGPPDPDLV